MFDLEGRKEQKKEGSVRDVGKVRRISTLCSSLFYLFAQNREKKERRNIFFLFPSKITLKLIVLRLCYKSIHGMRCVAVPCSAIKCLITSLNLLHLYIFTFSFSFFLLLSSSSSSSYILNFHSKASLELLLNTI